MAVAASLAAEGVRDLALLTENELVIRVAQEALELAISLAKAAVRNGEAAVKAYEDCTNETDHNIYMAGSGSCDSGGCD